MNRNQVFLMAALAAIIFGTQPALASGKLFARFPNQQNSPVFDLQLRKLSARVEIQDQLAVVHLDETFLNSQNRVMEGIYLLEMPEGSKLTGMALWIDGVRFEQEIKPRDEAVREFEEIVRRSVDPLLAEEIGDNLFRLRLFPLPPLGERRIEIEYIHPLPVRGDAIEFTLPLVLEDYDAGPVDSASVHVSLKSQAPIESVTVGSQVPAGKTVVTQNSATEFTLEFNESGQIFDYNFGLFYSIGDFPVFTVLSYVEPAAQDDGFYMLRAIPPAEFFPPNVESRDLVLCVDISASMIGRKLTQVKQGLISIVDRLRPEDRFNIVTFNTTVERFRTSLVGADAQNRSDARSYIQTLSATGLTDLNGALLSSLGMFGNSPKPAQILVISDGQPTAGVTNQNSILANVENANGQGVRIFPVGISGDVDRDFFTSVALRNNGTSFFINEDENIGERLELIFDQITAPLLTSIEIRAEEGLVVYDTQPDVLSNLPRGQQILQAGRYVSPGAGTLTLSAHNGQELVTSSFSMRLDDVPTNKSVSRFWAAQKIAALEKEIAELGEKEELIDAIVFLSIEYSVLSKYTAFLIVEPQGDVIISVDDRGPELPRTFALFQNYPNPFNPETTVRYQIGLSGQCDGACRVTLKIYNLLGELVRVLVDARKQPGEYSAVWDGRDDHGNVLPSGVYVYTLQAGSFKTSEKMLLLK